MRSHLARNACRRLLAQRGVRPTIWTLPNRCLCRQAAHGTPALSRQPPRRTFFNVFQKPPRQVKEPELEPGYYTLLQFRGRETENLRPPPREELVDGFRDLFKHKVRHHKRVNSTQAFCALRLFRHLLATSGESTELTLDDLLTAQTALLRIPTGSSEDHLELSRELYREILRRRDAGQQGEEDPVSDTLAATAFKHHVTALSQYDAAAEAADLLSASWQKTGVSRRDKELWVLVLRGLAKEGKEKELLNKAEAAEKAGLEYMPLFQEVMTTYYARENNLAETQKWFSKPLYGKYPPTPETYTEILQFSLRDKQAQKWTQKTFQELCDSNPYKALWDVIFQWAVLSLGKGVDEIKHMLETMARHNESRPTVRPDIGTINSLVKAAVEKRDPFLAERFIALGGELGLSPNYVTYALQLDYRITANDLSGAHATFEQLENVGCPNDEDLPVVNRYLRALCSAKPFNPGRLFDVLSIVEERQATLEPQTVVDVCMAFFRNDQQYEVIDTLSLHTFQYSLEERKVVRDAFVAYCLDRANSTARAWDGYSLLRQYFPETPADDRVRLMDGFFARRRPDMACYIFGHMRSHSNPSIRPTTDTYVRCLEGIGRSPDAEGLHMVHNMLKMDTTIELGTRLHNALMLAHAACDDAERAIDFWKEINGSAEGPSYRSLEIVFAVCEALPFGDGIAREIWSKIQRMDIEIPAAVYTAYCGAMAGSGAVEEVKALVSGMEESVGAAPTLMTLGVPFNALPGQELQANFETWGKEKYPELWDKLRKRGCQKTLEGLKRYKIVRELKA